MHHKAAILERLCLHKTILADPRKPAEAKDRVWKEVWDYALTLYAVNPDKDWHYLKNSLFQLWHKRAMVNFQSK